MFANNKNKNNNHNNNNNTNRKQPNKMKTTTTLRTLAFAAAAAMAFTTPSLKAADWDLPAGYTSINILGPYGPDTYDNIYIGSGGATILNLSGDASVQAMYNAVLGQLGAGDLIISENASFSAIHVTIGEAYNGYVDIKAESFQADAHLTAQFIDVGTEGYSGGLRVGGIGAYFYTAELRIGSGGDVTVTNNASATIADSVFIDIEGSLSVNYMGTLTLPDTELRFGLSTTVSGEIINDGGNVDFSYTTLAVLGNEVYDPAETFTIIEGCSVPDGYWGDTVTASDTGQVFNIDYTSVAGNISLVAQAIPEPSTYALLGGVGAVALAVLRRRRRKG